MYFVGIDVGGTNIAAGVTDSRGKLFSKTSVKTESSQGSAIVISNMIRVAENSIKMAGISKDEIGGIGIGLPATVDSEKGIIYHCLNVDIGDKGLANELKNYFNLPVYIDNDGNAAAYAEHISGSAKGSRHSITITLGTGIGGGIIVNNKIYRGFNGIAAEVGHMVIVANGQQCNCGRKGCWEQYASASALIREAREAAKNNPRSVLNEMTNFDLKKMNGRIPFQAARANDETAMEVVRKYIFYVATGLSNLIVNYQPECVCIGGGIGNEGEYLIEPVRKQVLNESYPVDNVPKTSIVQAKFGNDAGIIGAALLYLNNKQ